MQRRLYLISRFMDDFNLRERIQLFRIQVQKNLVTFQMRWRKRDEV